jgi:hypothetical protein
MKSAVNPAERGVALVFAVMAMTILMALGAALVLITSTETVIAGNFRNSRQAFYGAEAAGELAVAALRAEGDWNAVLLGIARAPFVDGEPAGLRRPPVDAPVDLTATLNLANCSTPIPCAGPQRWHLYAYGPLASILPGAQDPSFYIVALVSGAAGEDGGFDLTIRAEAFGPRAAHQALEIMVRRTGGSTEVVRTVFR